jgi:hypothetical protein
LCWYGWLPRHTGALILEATNDAILIFSPRITPVHAVVSEKLTNFPFTVMSTRFTRPSFSPKPNPVRRMFRATSTENEVDLAAGPPSWLFSGRQRKHNSNGSGNHGTANKRGRWPVASTSNELYTLQVDENAYAQGIGNINAYRGTGTNYHARTTLLFALSLIEHPQAPVPAQIPALSTRHSPNTCATSKRGLVNSPDIQHQRVRSCRIQSL